MRWLLLLLFTFGCAKALNTLTHSVESPVPTPMVSAIPSPTASPTPARDKVCAVSHHEEIMNAYRSWKLVLDPVFATTGCNVIIAGVSPPDNVTPSGSRYTGFWWFYDGVHHIWIADGNWYGALAHEIGHRFGLPHKLLPDGTMDCESIMSNCSRRGVTADDIENLREVLEGAKKTHVLSVL